MHAIVEAFSLGVKLCLAEVVVDFRVDHFSHLLQIFDINREPEES